MLLSLNIEHKKELQIMQNNVLRYCYNVRLLDCVSIVNLHERSKLSSLEQRRIRQLLGLQFLAKNMISKPIQKLEKDMRNHHTILEHKDTIITSLQYNLFWVKPLILFSMIKYL